MTVGYVLRAVIAAESLLRRAITAKLVPLGGGLALLPMTEEFFDSVTKGGPSTDSDGFLMLPTDVSRRLASWSGDGPVAYVEAEFFGGVGQQCAQVWAGGTSVLGPLKVREDEPLPAAGSPISQALRRLGVDRGDHHDEFDAIGLGRYRETEEWAERAR